MTKYIVAYRLNDIVKISPKFDSMLQVTAYQIKLDLYGISDSTIHLVNDNE